MLEKWTRLFRRTDNHADVQKRMDLLKSRVPAPVFWMFGKTQSGKTSIIKYLTGANTAEIGQGFRACTRFSRIYQFPTAEAPLVSFLDTRGLDEPAYDSAEGLARFNSETHAVIVTVKVLDQAQENVRNHLRAVRAAQPSRPVVLALTCLHEAYPHQQHPSPYPYDQAELAGRVPDALRRTIEEQRRQFADLVDHVVPLDLTPPEEGFEEPNYGGPRLREILLQVLPTAYRQTLASLEQAVAELHDLYAQPVLPHILGYSTLAASAGAITVPWVDLLLLPMIQRRMIYHLAEYFGRPLDEKTFDELAKVFELKKVWGRIALREAAKFVPIAGPVFCSVLAASSTYALGKSFTYYYRAVREGKVPDPEELRKYYREQLNLAEKAWRSGANGQIEGSGERSVAAGAG